MTRNEALKKAEEMLVRASALRQGQNGELALAYAETAKGYIELAKELRLGA